ncbi:hypothetical protein HDV00_008285 [Rhizophlyctis rosea]|nr:hypothetical protein HDV00_008285 [Rhizophlyctis rosea]
MPPVTDALVSALHLTARYQLDRSDAQEKAPNNVLGIYWAMFGAFIVCTAIAGAAAFAVTTVTVQKLQSYLSVAILGTCATAYWAMSAAEGQVTVNQGPNDNEGGTREFF